MFQDSTKSYFLSFIFYSLSFFYLRDLCNTWPPGLLPKISIQRKKLFVYLFRIRTGFTSTSNGSASPFGRIMFRHSIFAVAPRSCTTQRSFYANLPLIIPREQDELAGARSDAGSDETPTSPKASIPSLILPPAKALFTKFMKVFMEITQVQILTEP